MSTSQKQVIRPKPTSDLPSGSSRVPASFRAQPKVAQRNENDDIVRLRAQYVQLLGEHTALEQEVTGLKLALAHQHETSDMKRRIENLRLIVSGKESEIQTISYEAACQRETNRQLEEKVKALEDTVQAYDVDYRGMQNHCIKLDEHIARMDTAYNQLLARDAKVAEMARYISDCLRPPEGPPLEPFP